MWLIPETIEEPTDQVQGSESKKRSRDDVSGDGETSEEESPDVNKGADDSDSDCMPHIPLLFSDAAHIYTSDWPRDGRCRRKSAREARSP